MTEPLQITGTPEKRLCLNLNTGKKAKGWCIPTSEGWFTAKTLAERVGGGLTAAILQVRTKRLVKGEIEPEVFFAAPGAKLQPQPKKRVHMESEIDSALVPVEDYGKYAHLSGASRDENLRWIPGGGRWEKRWLEKTRCEDDFA